MVHRLSWKCKIPLSFELDFFLQKSFSKLSFLYLEVFKQEIIIFNFASEILWRKPYVVTININNANAFIF